MKFYTETHTDGSNAFIYSRFLTPFLCDYEGLAVFADGDMICRADIAELAALYDPTKAVQVVKHDYKTKAAIKYLGNKNENYPRKNWSSLILWNCGHPANRVLTPQLIQEKPGSFLHRFSWLDDSLVGALPAEWNWLETEYDPNPGAKLIHYTLGTPCFKDYEKSDQNYERALALDDKDASTLNNYAYFLSLRKIKLDKAEELSKRSNELEPKIGRAHV